MNSRRESHEAWDEVGRKRFSREDVVRYAGAAQDFNSIHILDESAQSLGFPNAVVHGMLTLGWALGNGFGNWSKAAGIGSVSARFESPIPVGESVRLRKRAVTEDRVCGEVHTANGKRAVTIDASFRSESKSGVVPSEALLEGEPMAVRALRVERGAAARFAAAVSAQHDVWYREDAARTAGFENIPTVPTYAFALPALGFFPDDPVNDGLPSPDLPRECREWARTSSPVVHAGQIFRFYRPLYVGMRVLARTAVTGRRSRTNAHGAPLEFTDVRTVVEDEEGAPISVSDMTLVVIGD